MKINKLIIQQEVKRIEKLKVKLLKIQKLENEINDLGFNFNIQVSNGK